MPSVHSTAYERNAPAPEVVDQALAPSKHAVFWLEDAPASGYPRLAADRDCDLLVVGAGYLGLWTAVLAKRRDPSLRVVVLEAAEVGGAASGRNGGFCEASLTHGQENGLSRWPEEYDVLDRLGRENLDEMEQDVVDLGLDCQWERTGTLQVAVEPHQVEWLGSDPTQVLDADRTRAQIDSPLFLASHWSRDDTALVHPARLARELARAATELGAEIFEHSPADRLVRNGDRVGVRTPAATVTADRVALATNAFPSLLRRNRLMTVPVYDYVLVTEPLDDDRLRSVGWSNRQGLTDLANQFHYSRLTADNRILYGGYDAIYHYGRGIRDSYEDRASSYRRLASHLLATFPQLEGITFTHRWAGVIDTSTQFAAFHGTSHGGRVAYAAGFTGLGVGATRFAANVMLDRLGGLETERTRLRMTSKRPLPFPPEPVAGIGINLTRWSLDRADHRQGRRNVFLRTLDALGLGFDS